MVKDDWLWWRLLHERPFTREGNYLFRSAKMYIIYRWHYRSTLLVPTQTYILKNSCCDLISMFQHYLVLWNMCFLTLDISIHMTHCTYISVHHNLAYPTCNSCDRGFYNCQKLVINAGYCIHSAATYVSMSWRTITWWWI